MLPLIPLLYSHTELESLLSQTWGHLQVCVADGSLSPRSKLYFEVDWTVPNVLVVGNEADGVRDEWKALLQEGKAVGCRIPLKNNVESLNAAVAGSMILSEALRQMSSATRNGSDGG